MHAPKFARIESKVPGQSDRIQPEFGGLVVAIDVHVRRFFGFMAVEVDAIGTRAQDGRHNVKYALSQKENGGP